MIEKTYIPGDIETRVAAAWEDAQAFAAGRPERRDAKPFCLMRNGALDLQQRRV
jgi:valyl-tRNA synthetase